MSTFVFKPQPLPSVLYGTWSGYCRFTNRWFWHLSPALHTCSITQHQVRWRNLFEHEVEGEGLQHTCGWHSQRVSLLMQLVPSPHGFSMSGEHSQALADSGSALWTCTLPTGTFVLMCLYGGGCLCSCSSLRCSLMVLYILQATAASCTAAVQNKSSKCCTHKILLPP